MIGFENLRIEVTLRDHLISEANSHIDWYLTSNMSSYAPILFPWMGEEKLIQINTQIGQGMTYYVQMNLTKKKKLKSTRYCSTDHVPIVCGSKK